jgi:hypothetical protein
VSVSLCRVCLPLAGTLMTDALDGVLAKLNRAAEHLLLLSAEVSQYLASNPYDLVAYKDQRHSLVGFALRFKQQPSLRIATILGDCLQNTRSALDYLAWQLVVAHGLTPSAKAPVTQFPIHTNHLKSGKPRVVSISPGIDAEALRLVEESQPYKSPGDANAHPLAVLSELCNRDKHRQLNLTVGAMLGATVTLVSPATKERFTAPTVKDPAYHDDSVGIFELPQGLTDLPGDWDVESRGLGFVSIMEAGPWHGRAVQLIAKDLLDFVADTLVPKFSPFLKGAAQP